MLIGMEARIVEIEDIFRVTKKIVGIYSQGTDGVSCEFQGFYYGL